ncbi:MAG: hypothetical protein WAT67_02230 [Candidatus Contendobacter sp.]
MPKKKGSAETTADEKSSKTTKNTTAATKPAAETKAPPKAPKKTTKAPVAKAEKPAAANSTAETAKAPAPKAEKPAALTEPVKTVIIARFDVGHGNNLYIRGDGHSLSWETGVRMENMGGDAWQWTTTEAREGVLAFKLLINDEIWAVGENMTASFGETTSFHPSF